MTTTAMPEPASNPVTAPSPDAPRPGTGAAVHRDLYKTDADPAAERQRLKGEARTLGLGFFVFFSLLLGGLLSLVVFNGALRPGWAGDLDVCHHGWAETALPGGVPPLGMPELLLDSGGRKPVETIALPDGKLVVGPAPAAGARPVRLLRERKDALLLYAPLEASEKVSAVALPGFDPLLVSPSPVHAWSQARLARVFPTRYLIMFGVFMGAIGVAAPAALIPFYRFWMRCVAAPLGWFNTRVILALVYYLMMTPLGVWFWLRRKVSPETDMLKRGSHPGSYWEARTRQRPRKHFERLF